MSGREQSRKVTENPAFPRGSTGTLSDIPADEAGKPGLVRSLKMEGVPVVVIDFSTLGDLIVAPVDPEHKIKKLGVKPEQFHLEV